MKNFKHGLILMAVGVSTSWFGQYVHADDSAANTFARETRSGVKVDTSVWLYSYDEDSHPTTIAKKLDTNELQCSHQLQDQVFNRAKTNARLKKLLATNNFLLQIDLSVGTDSLSNWAAVISNTTFVDQKHLYLRAPFRVQGVDDNIQGCSLPVTFDAEFPPLPSEDLALNKALKAGEEAQQHMNAVSAHAEKISLQKEKDSGVRPATFDDSDGTSLGVKPAGHF